LGYWVYHHHHTPLKTKAESATVLYAYTLLFLLVNTLNLT
jgi:hypothetical protein